jgi:UDP-N-acetylglucosamine transferase subunit ALG13
VSLVVALVGTDHHRFDRMVDWLDGAAQRHPTVEFVVQHGASRPPAVAQGRAYVAHDALVALLAGADVVVCHGGPGTIMDARAAGHVPICVPRDPRRGEHVDDHQMRFAGLVAAAEVVRLADDVEAFMTLLDQSLRSARGPRAIQDSASTVRARESLASELDRLALVGSSRGARWWHRR